MTIELMAVVDPAFLFLLAIGTISLPTFAVVPGGASPSLIELEDGLGFIELQDASGFIALEDP